jgi:hypothetical protein
VPPRHRNFTRAPLRRSKEKRSKGGFAELVPAVRMEWDMSENQQLRNHEPPKPGTAREQLEHLYRAIGIQAVAAAAAQVKRTEPQPQAVRELPIWMREDRSAA